MNGESVMDSERRNGRSEWEATHNGEGEVACAKIVHGAMDVPAQPWKFDFPYTNFSPSYSPISIPFVIEKHLVLLKLGALK